MIFDAAAGFSNAGRVRAGEIVTVPSSSMLMVVPVSSVRARMAAPPLPMTSRILSGSILKETMRGAKSESSLAPPPAISCMLAEDVLTAVVSLSERSLHDFGGDAFDLDVHLERRDAVCQCRPP